VHYTVSDEAKMIVVRCA